MRRRRQPGRARSILARMLTAVAVLLIAVVVVDLRVRPIVEDVVAYQANMTAMRTINAAMLQEMNASTSAYDHLVRLTRAEDGSVTSIQTDILAVNRLKSQIAETVAAEFQQPENSQIYVPLGTLLGGNLTSGRGPAVEIRLIPIGYVESELYNQFTSAGINQTLHQIMLETTVQMAAVMPGYSVRTQASTSFCVAETVIVGAIPDGYTIVDGDNRSSLSKMHDYRVG